jgi:hypothetical protein
MEMFPPEPWVNVRVWLDVFRMKYIFSTVFGEMVTVVVPPGVPEKMSIS